MKGKRGLTIMAMMLAMVLLAGQVWAEPITIEWWHAMRGARGETLDKMVKAFNDSQNEYKVVAANKGDYGEVVNAGGRRLSGEKTSPYPYVL